MRCLVINLDRSVDRLAHVTGEFVKIGIPFERVAAVDANTVSLSCHLTRPEAACFLSHRACWQIIADGADRFSAVFEDDVVFSHDAGAMLSDDGWVPIDADVVKLETFYVRVRMGRAHSVVGNGYSVTRLVGRHLGSAGYVVSREAAKKLLQGTKRLKGTVDYALFSPTLMTCSRNTIYQLTPALCVQSYFVLGDASLPTLIQFATPRRRKRIAERLLAEAARTFAHLRNGSLLGSRQVDAVEFRPSRPTP